MPTRTTHGLIYQEATFEAAHSHSNGVPVYRFFNQNTGYHFFTASEAEAKIVRDNSASGAWPFIDEGVAYWVYANDPNPAYVGQEVAVHRFYNPSSDRHVFTASTEEVNELKLTGVWSYEGIAFWGEVA